MSTRPEDLKQLSPSIKERLAAGKVPLAVQQMVPSLSERGTFLVYGGPGAGKTWLAGTFPTPFFADMRGGLKTVRHKKIGYFRPTTYMQMLQCVAPENLEPYQTVVLDQGTEACRLLMQEALFMSQREAPQLQDWQLVIERFRRIVVALTDDDGPLKDKHIVVICEEAIEKNEITGSAKMLPAVPGKFATEIGSFFDCMFHLQNVFNPATQKKGRWLLTEPDGAYDAKDRFNALDKLEVPDFGVIWNKILEHDKSLMPQAAKLG